jgi:hypothetical protein
MPLASPDLRSPPSTTSGLDVSGCLRLGDAALTAAAHHAPRLAVLRAARCQRFSDRGVLALGSRLHATLLDLALGPLPGLTDAGIAELARLTSLTRLELRSCGGVSDGGLGPLTALRRLSVLDVAGCARISANGLMALSSLTRVAQIVL